MPRYPAATWRPISRNYTARTTRKTRVILHTSASATATSLHGWFSNPSAGASSHFHVDSAGRGEQYLDTDHISWASGEGNADSISVETQGDGTAPWTPAQVDAIVAILRWAHVHVTLAAMHGAVTLGQTMALQSALVSSYRRRSQRPVVLQSTSSQTVFISYGRGQTPSAAAQGTLAPDQPVLPAFPLPAHGAVAPVQTASASHAAGEPVVTATPGRLGHALGVQIARSLSVGQEHVTVRLERFGAFFTKLHVYIALKGKFDSD